MGKREKPARGTNDGEVLSGGPERDVIRGRGGDDGIYGAGGDDRLFGGDGDDDFVAGGGDDRIDGGAGWDSAAYAASVGGYQFSFRGGALIVENLGGPVNEGTDTLRDVEELVFRGGRVDVALIRAMWEQGGGQPIRGSDDWVTGWG
ncbi:MAG TPA: hypothetical protein VD929_10270 [Caulobacteraceae bacterium]|nr:hypothetical protein [Caulobacteraceae bacterium]